MGDLQTILVLAQQLRELVLEDDRLIVPVGVDQLDRTRCVRERGLQDRDAGRDPGSPAEEDDRRIPVLQDEDPVRRHDLERVPGRNGVVHPVGGAPVDHALDRHLVGGIQSRRAGERVTANETLPVHLDAKTQELPRLVGEALGELGGNVEHDRLAVVGFLDHVGDAEIEIRATGLGTGTGGVHG